MTTIETPTPVAKTRAKRRSFKEVAATAHAKGHADGYAAASRQYQEVQQRLLAQNKALQACLDKGIWSRLTGLFKGGRHDL